MNKKEFYEAPEWGLRTVMVERRMLADSYNEDQHTEYLGEEEDGGDLS